MTQKAPPLITPLNFLYFPFIDIFIPFSLILRKLTVIIPLCKPLISHTYKVVGRL